MHINVVAAAGWPSPLRGSVSLDGFIPMLRIGPSRLEPVLQAEPNPARDSENENAGPNETGILVCGSGGVICAVPTISRRIRLK
jgi:hypothetical protein